MVSCTSDYDDRMDTLEELKDLGDYQRKLPGLRAEVVAKAREEGKTWRQIADALGMTQNAVIAADKAYRAGK